MGKIFIICNIKINAKVRFRDLINVQCHALTNSQLPLWLCCTRLPLSAPQSYTYYIHMESTMTNKLKFSAFQNRNPFISTILRYIYLLRFAREFTASGAVW